MKTRLLSTRAGALGIAVVLAVTAVAVVLLYTQSYRSNVDRAGDQITVLVANQTIRELTPGNQVLEGKMFREAEISADSMVDGAITDADQLKGLVARNDVYPGEQLTTNQFQRSDTTSPSVKLESDQRAIAFPVDEGSGLIGNIQAGDRVDIIATFDVMPVTKKGLSIPGAITTPVTKTIATDVLVLSAPFDPAQDGGNLTSNEKSRQVLTLAVPVSDAQHVVFAQEEGRIYFALRPAGESADIRPAIDDVLSVLRDEQGARAFTLALLGAKGAK